MYTKNLKYTLTLRLDEAQMTFLKELADINCMSVSDVVRRLLLLNQLGMEDEFYGNSETFIND